MKSSTNPPLRTLLAVTAALVVTAACGGGGGGGAGPADTPVTLAPGAANIVATWYDAAAATINVPGAATGTPEEQRPTLSVDMATVHVAIYDAVVAVVGGHQPFAATPSGSAAGASVDAAASAAAYEVLRALFPNRAAQYQSVYDAALAKIADGDAKARGLQVGKEVAVKIVALRANDGRSVQLAPYVPGTAPGKFRGSNPINRFLPPMKPFVLTSAAEFRPPGPPSLMSSAYANDVNETKVMAGTASTARSAQQTEIAQFHTEPPPPFQTRNYRVFASSRSTVADNARLAAQMWVAVADATQACFEAKYHYEAWRPTSAITLADTDGNAATEPDTAWTPHVATPNHPEYPAAHSCVAGAISETLARHFGTRRVAFSFNSNVTGTTHAYESVDAFISESSVARIWGGMHFRTSTEHGAALGKNVASKVADLKFRPAN